MSKAEPALASSRVADLHRAGRAEELVVSPEGTYAGHRYCHAPCGMIKDEEPWQKGVEPAETGFAYVGIALAPGPRTHAGAAGTSPWRQRDGVGLRGVCRPSLP